MDLIFVYSLLFWTFGLYWFLCKFIFPIDPLISKGEIALVLFNQILHSILFIRFRHLFSNFIFPKNFFSIFYQLGIFILSEEFFFYYSHRLLHQKWFYQNIHYIHHQWKLTYSDIALYSHPIEHLINISGTVIFPILLQSDFITIFLWTTIIIINTTYVHSGINSKELHDIHHRIPFTNYGVLGLLDRIHGTFFYHQ